MCLVLAAGDESACPEAPDGGATVPLAENRPPASDPVTMAVGDVEPLSVDASVVEEAGGGHYIEVRDGHQVNISTRKEDQPDLKNLDCFYFEESEWYASPHKQKKNKGSQALSDRLALCAMADGTVRECVRTDTRYYRPTTGRPEMGDVEGRWQCTDPSLGMQVQDDLVCAEQVYGVIDVACVYGGYSTTPLTCRLANNMPIADAPLQGYKCWLAPAPEVGQCWDAGVLKSRIEEVALSRNVPDAQVRQALYPSARAFLNGIVNYVTQSYAEAFADQQGMNAYIDAAGGTGDIRVIRDVEEWDPDL